MSLKFLTPLLALGGLSLSVSKEPRFTPGSRGWQIPTGSNLTGPGGRMMPRTKISDRYRRKNPTPGGRGHYQFTAPVAPANR